MNASMKQMLERHRIQKKNEKEWEEEKRVTFDINKQIEDPIACITSTAEQIASFRFWTSA